MSDASIKLSSRGAFSYHWNKCIESDDSCLIRTVKSLVGFFQGLLGGYTVSEADIISIFNKDKHGESIFYKEYTITLGNRKTEIVNDVVSTAHDGVVSPAHDEVVSKEHDDVVSKEHDDVVSAEEEEDDDDEVVSMEEGDDKVVSTVHDDEVVSTENDEASGSEGASVKNPLFNKLKELLSDNSYVKYAENFSADNIMSIGTDDALWLFNYALEHGGMGRTALANLLLDTKGVQWLQKKLSGHAKAKTLCLLAYCGRVNDLETLLADDNNEVNWEIDTGSNTPLILAAYAGRKECIEVLLKNGAKVNQNVGIKGRNALFYARGEGHTECVNLLLSNGASDNAHDETPLEEACRMGNKENIDRLLACPRAQVNRANRVGMTPLSIALINGDLGCLESLLNDTNIDVNKLNGQRMTPLFVALRSGMTSIPCLKKFLNAQGLKFDAVDKDGNTLLHACLEIKDMELIKALLEKKVIADQINRYNTNGFTAFHLATIQRNVEFIKVALLKIEHIDVNKEDLVYGNAPLHWAAENGDMDTMEVLMGAAGINVNNLDSVGNKPSHRLKKDENIKKYAAMLARRNDVAQGTTGSED